ncbi:MAG TPA: rod shape-determining protein MreD [Gammaproteobacteria bacterium]
MRFSPLVSVFVALLLAAMPLPQSIIAFKPDWVALTLIYWTLTAPPAFGLASAFVIGLALDALTGSLLGQHTLGLLLIVYVCSRFRLRLRAFPIVQSTIVVAVLLAANEFLLLWIDGIAGRTVPIGERWPPIASGTLLWLVVWSTFDRGREHAPARL